MVVFLACGFPSLTPITTTTTDAPSPHTHTEEKSDCLRQIALREYSLFAFSLEFFFLFSIVIVSFHFLKKSVEISYLHWSL